jgi:adenylate cyclase
MDSPVERKLTTILSADAVGYSRLMGEDEAATLATLKAYRAACAALIDRHRGRIVGTAGDSMLAEFASVVRAVECAVAMQREIAERNASLSQARRMHFRIGVNLGDVLVEQDDLYGDGVNIAARLQALADPGGILISGPVFDQVRDKLSLGFDFLGDQSVKNIAAQVPVYRVQLGGGAPPANVSSSDAPPVRGAAATKSADPRWHRFNIIALRWGAILGALLVINLLTWNGDFWFVWPALAIIVVFALHASWIFRHRSAK